MIQLFKHTYFKYLLLLLLAFKASYFVVENYQVITSTEISFFLDLNDFENENEEKQELDENKKINEPIVKNSFTEDLYIKRNHLDLHKNYRNLHFEFTTPPPELS